MKTVQFDTSVITMYFRWHMYALLGCQKGELSASDNLINSYLCIHWFFEKVKSRFPTVFQRTSCTLQHSFEVQSTIKSTQYIQKYINVLLDVLCTLFPFLVEKILIPTCQCTFGCTVYFQKWKCKVHPKVQSTSKSTKYTTHACFNQFLRIRLQQKRKVHPINCDVLETIILTSAKISSGRAGLPSMPSKPLLLTHFLYEC